MSQRGASRMIRDALAQGLSLLRDPRIPDGLCITYVRVGHGGSTAVVGVSGPEGRSGTALRALGRAGHYLARTFLAPLRLRRIPRLRFEWDDSVESAMRIDALLKGADHDD
ncbi:ribosome-binding factor A, partial [bacterium]|nr:ribosome-binding factor A [bacterium]